MQQRVWVRSTKRESSPDVRRRGQLSGSGCQVPGRRTGFTPRTGSSRLTNGSPTLVHAREIRSVSADEVWRCGHALRVMAIFSLCILSRTCNGTGRFGASQAPHMPHTAAFPVRRHVGNVTRTKATGSAARSSARATGPADRVASRPTGPDRTPGGGTRPRGSRSPFCPPQSP